MFDIRQAAARTRGVSEYERASVDRSTRNKRNKEWDSSGGGCGMRKKETLGGVQGTLLRLTDTPQ